MLTVGNYNFGTQSAANENRAWVMIVPMAAYFGVGRAVSGANDCFSLLLDKPGRGRGEERVDDAGAVAKRLSVKRVNARKR